MFVFFGVFFVFERILEEKIRPDLPSINIIGEIPEEKFEFVMSSGRLTAFTPKFRTGSSAIKVNQFL